MGYTNRLTLVKLDNTPSRKVGRFDEIEGWLPKMKEMIDGTFDHPYCNTAYALAHCQVKESGHYAFFVVNTGFVENDVVKDKTMLFSDRVIINPEILEMPEMIEVEMKDTEGKMKKVQVYNLLFTSEGCLSFKWRKSKRVERYHRIKVRYQTNGVLGLKTHEEWVDGLKSRVFQHECQHINEGNSIYHKPNVQSEKGKE